MRFHTTILQADKNATGIQIPAEVVESLGAGKRPPRAGYDQRLYLSQYGGSDGRGVYGWGQRRAPQRGRRRRWR